MKILFVWIVTCLIWSTVWLFIKLGLRDLPPVSFAGIRLFIALAVLLPFIALRRIPLPREGRDLRMIAVTGLLLLGLNYGLVFWGAQHISSGLTAVLQAATPAFGLVFAGYYLPQERFTLLKLCAVLIGIGGVAVIFSNQLQIAGWTALLGCAAVIGGALCVAFSYVLVKAHGGHLHPLVLTAGQMICGLVPLVVYGLIQEGNPLQFRWTATAALSLLYLALAGSVAAFGLNYWLLQRTDATKILLMSIVEPPLAMLLGVIVLGEAVTERVLWGSVCILLSVGLILFRPNTRAHAQD
ncbi:MAG TPA: DMT family transporter [Pyrinomonadaceae bacterium]|nr:DMT family transporter [Pyrinomonadaceae bacterium]